MVVVKTHSHLSHPDMGGGALIRTDKFFARNSLSSSRKFILVQIQPFPKGTKTLPFSFIFSAVNAHTPKTEANERPHSFQKRKSIKCVS